MVVRLAAYRTGDIALWNHDRDSPDLLCDRS